MPPQQGKNWVVTLNNYTEDERQALLTCACKYVVLGREVGEQGVPHLQGYIRFATNQRLRAVRAISPRAHWELSRGNFQQASDYCKKDGDFEEVGDPPVQGQRSDLLEVAEKVKQGVSVQAIANDHSVTYIRYHRGIRELALVLQQPYEHDSTRGVWIHGAPGTGKSHCARAFDPQAYIKPQNKWFDGYHGQACIILDDCDTNVLGHYLKIWADKYSCTGETKGGTIQLRHTKFIVTSNYHPSELWTENAVMLAAIERRFDIFEKTSREQEIVL